LPIRQPSASGRSGSARSRSPPAPAGAPARAQPTSACVSSSDSPRWFSKRCARAANQGGIRPCSTTSAIIAALAAACSRVVSAKGAIPPSTWQLAQWRATSGAIRSAQVGAAPAALPIGCGGVIRQPSSVVCGTCTARPASTSASASRRSARTSPGTLPARRSEASKRPR
jgi:hypothetical protein